MSAQHDEAQSLSIYLNIVWKHRRLVLVFAAIVLVGTAFFTKQITPIYKASVEVVIDPTAPQILPGAIGTDVVPLGTANYWNTDDYFGTQYRVIRSRKVAERVVERLGLARDLNFLGIDEIEDPDERAMRLEAADPVLRLVGAIEVEPIEKSHVVRIDVRDKDPKRAARIADELAKVYAEVNIERKISGADEARTWLTRQADQLAEEVQNAERALLEFKKQQGILSASLAGRQNLVAQKLTDAHRQLAEAEAERIRYESTRDQVRGMDPGEEAFGLEISEGRNLIQHLKQQVVDLQNERTELLKRYLEGHPDVVAVDAKIQRVQGALDKELRGIRRAFDQKLAAALSTEARLKANLDKIKDEAQSLNAVELEYKRLDSEVSTRKDLHKLILVRLKEAELQSKTRANNIRILDTALVPSRAVSPRLTVNMAAAALLALIGGIGLALIVDNLDASVKSQEMLEGELGLTFLGLVPLIQPNRKPKHKDEPQGSVNPDRYVLDYPKSTAAECVRTVRTNLMFMAPEQELRKLLVASAGPREGKTCTTANIGATMALSGSKILLVDSDLRRPRLHRIFGFKRNRGLTDLVLDPNLPLADVVNTDTGIENLHVLSSGQIPPNPAELLHTNAFKRTVEKLLDDYDRVIFDSPPVTAVTDAQIIGNYMDGAILVVRAGDTHREMVRKAARLLSDVNVNLLGALLNGVDLTGRSYGQYYHYYRNYGQYYAEENPEAAEG